MTNDEMVTVLGLAVRLVHAEEAHRAALRTPIYANEGAAINRLQMDAYAEREAAYQQLRRIVLRSAGQTAVAP